MADDVAITAGAGTTIATDEIGGRHFQRVKITWGPDGTANDPGDSALPVSIAGGATSAKQDTIIGHVDGIETLLGTIDTRVDGLEGLIGTTNSTLTTIAGYLDNVETLLAAATPAGENHIGGVHGAGFDVAVVPTVTNGAYSAGDIMGGLLTFANVARVSDEPVLITGVQVVSRAAVLPNLTLVLFNADPSSTTKTDNAVYSLNAADAFKVVAAIALGSGWTDHGTPNSIRYDNLGILAKPVSGGRDLYGLLIDSTGVTLTSTGDIQVRLRGMGA